MKKKLIFAALSMVATLATAQNPYLPLWEHLPDGEPRVFEDPDNPGKMRAYIIGSHDVKFTEYCGNDIRIWSAPVEDLTDWRDEGPVFSHYVNGKWDTMFAPDLVEVKDKTTGKKTYWLYPHSRGWRRVAMVCKGDRPDGPFTPVISMPMALLVSMVHSSILTPRYLLRIYPIRRIPTMPVVSVHTSSMVSVIPPLSSLIRTICMQSVLEQRFTTISFLPPSVME